MNKCPLENNSTGLTPKGGVVTALRTWGAIQVITQGAMEQLAQGSAFSLNSHLSACSAPRLSCSVGSQCSLARCVFTSSSVTWQGWLLFSWGLFHLQLLTVMRRKLGQSISSMLLLQPLPDLSLLWSTQGKGHVCIAPGLFLTAVFICPPDERHL